MLSAYFLISGKVQGVFFRATTKEKAAELGLTGWVQNTDSGDVAILAQGPLEKLDLFEAWCRKGPARARVDSFIRDEKECGELSSFTIIK